MNTELRKFGLTFGIIFGLISGYMFWQQKESYYYFAALAVIFALVGLLAPSLLKYVFKAWMFFAKVLSWINIRILLTALFILILTPIALIMRLFGKQFIDLKWDRNNKSYWNYRDNTVSNKSDIEKQY